jgi:hypothetical protein
MHRGRLLTLPDTFQTRIISIKRFTGRVENKTGLTQRRKERNERKKQSKKEPIKMLPGG